MTDSLTAPQNLEAEEYVLGACLLSENAIAATSEVVSPADFYRHTHGIMYQAILDRFAGGLPVDPGLLIEHLREQEVLDRVGGSSRVQELAAIVPATANAPHHARIVHDMATLRRLQEAGRELVRLTVERPGTTPEIVEQAEKLVFDVSLERARGELTPIGPAITTAFQQIRDAYERGDEIVGLPSGFPSLDAVTSGFYPGNLILLAARPSMGKSALALGIALNLARVNKPVGLFSLEMSRAEVVQRLLALQASVNAQAIRTGRIRTPDEWHRVAHAAQRITEAPIYVDDEPGTTMLQIRTKARRLKARQPDLALIVVDYLQLIHGPGEMYERVTAISRALKVLARDLELPVLALAQLNRELERRPVKDRRPVLSDLRDSGALEQDADLVMFLFREHVYDKNALEGEAEVGIAKHRNGPVGRAHLAWQKDYARFGELAK